MNRATYNIVMVLICKLVTVIWRNLIVSVKVLGVFVETVH